MSRGLFCSGVMLFVGLLIVPTGCERPQSSSHAPTVPADLQEAVDSLVRAVETFDVAQVLDVYADDFTSGTGRSKEGVAEILARLQASHVSLTVERTEVEEAGPVEAKVKTHLRLRYIDRFRNLGEGEVVITDVLRHSLRKEPNGWKIYTDQRVASYRDGRFGSQPPNVKIEVPKKLPAGLVYPVTVSVQREAERVYHVMIGNYAEDPGVLPPPDVVTRLPDDGVLKANLIPNPQGLNEMVRVTVIAADVAGKWLGATTVSTLIPSEQRHRQRRLQQAARIHLAKRGSCQQRTKRSSIVISQMS